jgi:hypothetical protein
MIKQAVAAEMIQSRLLVLQSKRLMLNSCQRRLDAHGADTLRRRVEQLRRETDQAQYRYRTIMLAWGSAENADYWLVAYAKLIEMGNVLSARLRDATAELPPSERSQVSADVETLQGIVEDWTRRMRSSMSAAVA